MGNSSPTPISTPTPPRPIYKCSECEKTFDIHNDVQEHLILSHFTYSCTVQGCLRFFNTKPLLDEHIKIHDIKKCPSCYNNFSNSEDYAKHITQCFILGIIVNNKEIAQLRITGGNSDFQLQLRSLANNFMIKTIENSKQ